MHYLVNHKQLFKYYHILDEKKLVSKTHPKVTQMIFRRSETLTPMQAPFFSPLFLVYLNEPTLPGVPL